MLAFLFRGVFLVGVIGWYSASLWKTVDDYFKSQFQRYLDEEYQRNPRMREDVRAYTTATVDKAASDLIVAETCSNDVCPIDKAELAATAAAAAAAVADVAVREVKSYRDESVPLVDFGAGAAAEIEVARPAQHTDEQPEFRDSPVDEAVPPPAGLHEEIPPTSPPAIRDSGKSSKLGKIKQPAEKIKVPKQIREQRAKKEPKEEENQSSPQLQKTARAKKRPKIAAKSGAKSKVQQSTKREIKQHGRIPTLKLSDEDFDEAERFFEFDYDEDSNEGFRDNFEDDDDDGKDFNGIPLKDLPFKPLIDVYDLERVSEEEFCPLSLDDDPTCDELRSWP